MSDIPKPTNEFRREMARRWFDYLTAQGVLFAEMPDDTVVMACWKADGSETSVTAGDFRRALAAKEAE